MSEYVLIHHGIKGQRWGDRNGPPYPLSSSAKSSTEKKKLTSGNNKKYNDEGKEKKKGLSDKQKKIIKIGAAAAVTALAAYGTYRLVKSGKLNPLFNKGKEKVQTLLQEENFGSQSANNFKSTQKHSGLFETVTKADGDTYLKDFNKNYASERSNCGYAVAEFFAKKLGIPFEASAAEVKNEKVLPSPNVHKLFPNALEDDEFIPRKALTSKETFDRYIADRMKAKCEGKDGFGALTILKKEVVDPQTGKKELLGHVMPWDIVDGKFTLYETDGQLNPDYYSTFRNFANGHGLGRRGLKITFFNAVGDIDRNALKKFGKEL